MDPGADLMLLHPAIIKESCVIESIIHTGTKGKQHISDALGFFSWLFLLSLFLPKMRRSESPTPSSSSSSAPIKDPEGSDKEGSECEDQVIEAIGKFGKWQVCS